MGGIVSGPGEGEAIVERDERTIRILGDHEHLTLSWFRYGPGQDGPDPHVHHRHTDAFYVLEGELEVGLGPDVEWLRAPAGTLVAAPPDVVHTFRNASDASAVFLNLHAPSMGFGEMLRARRDGRHDDAEHFDQFDPPADGGRPLADAVVTGPGEGERLARGNREAHVKAELPHLGLVGFELEGHFVGPDLHTHDDHVDSFYVLEGELELTVDGRIFTAGPGTLVAAPPGVEHTFGKPGTGRARFLNVHAPDAGFVASLRRKSD